MSNLVFRSKSCTFISVVILFVFSFSSCRKKIEHTPSSSEPVARWRLIKTLDYQATALEVFNGELYVAGTKWGSNYYIPTLQKIDANYNLINFQNGTFSKVYSGNSYEDPKIFKLHATADKLYIGGNFKFSIGNATSLMYYDLNGNFTPIPMLTQNAYYVSSFSVFQNDLIVGGYFGSDEPLVNTYYTEKIQNDVAVGFGDFPAKVIALSMHSNELYGIGENKTIRKWNGFTWSAISYNNPGSYDYLFDICSYNNVLYLLGNFDSNGYVALKKLNASGTWENVPEITYVNSGKLKVIDDKLYLFGNRIELNGENISEVLVYDGNTWKPVGNIRDSYISDLIKFNGKLICNINSRLYSYE